jgi:hypothetical protein
MTPSAKIIESNVITVKRALRSTQPPIFLTITYKIVKNSATKKPQRIAISPINLIIGGTFPRF